MALTIIDPGIYQTLVPWWWNEYEGGSPVYVPGPDNLNLSGLTDVAEKEPIFDTQHEKFTNPIVDNASQNAIGDNSNGVEPTITVEPTLSYSYTTGYSATHETSGGVTVGITQDFSYDFIGIGGSTTLSASGSFNWSNSSTEDHTTTVTNSVSAPFPVPAGKIFEEKLLFEQQQVEVPYALVIHIDGQDNILFRTGDSTSTTDSSFLFAAANDTSRQFTPPPPAYKDIKWSDFWGEGFQHSHATYSLHGTLKIEGASTFIVKVYDITNSGSQSVQAEYDPAIPIGVHRIMGDDGHRFRDTPFDDWVDGGAGDDVIRLSGGEDIAHAGGGNDRIIAVDTGRSLLDGGEGHDVIRLISDAPYGTVLGGDGNDRIDVNAPAAMLYGGAGNDRYSLVGGTAGGTVITDNEGRNRLEIDNGCIPLGFERLPHDDDLYILLGGGSTYNRERDVVWLDFFSESRNRVDGLRAEEIEEISTVFRPAIAPAPEVDALL